MATATAPTKPSDPGLEPAERLLTLDEALMVAQRMHRAGHFTEAETLYRAVIERRPDDPDACHFLGVLQHQRGDSDSAIALVRRAIAALPGEPGPWNNLGNIYVEAGRGDDALHAYQRCLEIAPDFADALNNVGTLHRLRSDWSAAESSYQRAIAARPDFADAYNNLAKLMIAQRRIREGVTYACKAITLLPRDPEARKLLGMAYYTLGEIDKAAEVYREWLAAEPENPIALHHLAACSGEAVPARASDTYVAQTFDAFADSFDAKLQLLAYRAPQLVATALRKVYGEPTGTLAVLDAGCGTGLCGPLVREFAIELVGIDLSQRMLARARNRGVYDRVEAAELLGNLASQSERYDVVVSADTLCYFGELDAVAHAAFGALRMGGTLVFTVEALPQQSDADYRLQAHGRYAHSCTYVSTCLRRAGLELLSIERETLRREGGVAVDGWLVSARKPAPASTGMAQ